MSTINHPKGLRGWTELCSDYSWEDYHGMWARKCKATGAWYVLKWTNLYDAMGERDCLRDGIPQYECEVKHLDLSAIPESEKTSALRSCGYRFNVETGAIEDEHNGSVVAPAEHADLALVECLVQYGLGAPLECFTGNVRPSNVRANARRFAEDLMRDATREKLRSRLSRPVNALGSTAFEYGIGDFKSAMERAAQPSVRVMRQSDMLKCAFAIMVPEHYRADGSCKCDDPTHRAKMIAEWGYAPSDFAS